MRKVHTDPTTRTTQSSTGSSARVTGPGGSTTAVGRSNSGDLYEPPEGVIAMTIDCWYS